MSLLRDEIADLAPLMRRAVTLDGSALVRLRRGRGTVSALVRLPFGVLAARTIVLDDEAATVRADTDVTAFDATAHDATAHDPTAHDPTAHRPTVAAPADFDTTVRCDELLAWVDGDATLPPRSRDADWRGSIPPTTGWQRVDKVPDAEVRPLIRAGALTLKEAAAREGVPGAQPRAEVADALLDSVVLTVTDGPRSVAITLRTLSAVTRLGFLPRGSYVAVDMAGRWVRVAAAYGSVYAERAGSGLGLLAR